MRTVTASTGGTSSGTTSTGATGSPYIFDNRGSEAVPRFASLQQQYDPVSVERLGALGVTPGMRCLEIGAGGGSIAAWLADAVGPDGSVLATDLDPQRLDTSAGNLEIRRHDLTADPLPEATFDLVHARLVLIHLADRQALLRKLWRALRPGGCLLLEDFDLTRLPVLQAPDPAATALFGRVTGGVHRLVELGGGDPAWGRHTYAQLAEVGYAARGATGFCEAWTFGPGTPAAALHRANVDQVRSRLLEHALVTEADLACFEELLDDRDFVAMSYLLVSTWGYRP